ncbi:MAG TPA: hypothetical protein VK157_11915 [Phycisphaerales bacterium]|nr:hypothetical protein [Phycisphaerales bacterium]
MKHRFFHLRGRGFTIIEASLSLVVVSVVAIAGLSAVSVARKSRASVADAVQGRMYADALLAEVASKRYRDAVSPAEPLGPDATDDIGLAAWRTVDDMDDYNGFAMSPITDVNGNDLSSGAWGAMIQVSWVSLADPSIEEAAESGVKRISVAVYKQNKIVARASTLRTLGADAAFRGENP